MHLHSSQHSHTDFWQALSGAVLALFVCVHLILEGSAALSPSLTNGIGWLLEKLFIAQFVAPTILIFIIMHFIIAARKMPFRAKEVSVFYAHSKELRQGDTWLWLVQVATALVILVIAFAHIYVVMSTMPITTEASAARLQSGWIYVYAILLPCVILHTGIGIYRIAVKYGFCVRRVRSNWQKWVWVGMGCYLLLGVLSLTRVNALG